MWFSFSSMAASSASSSSPPAPVLSLLSTMGVTDFDDAVPRLLLESMSGYVRDTLDRSSTLSHRLGASSAGVTLEAVQLALKVSQGAATAMRADGDEPLPGLPIVPGSRFGMLVHKKRKRQEANDGDGQAGEAEAEEGSIGGGGGGAAAAGSGGTRSRGANKAKKKITIQLKDSR